MSTVQVSVTFWTPEILDADQLEGIAESAAHIPAFIPGVEVRELKVDQS